MKRGQVTFFIIIGIIILIGFLLIYFLSKNLEADADVGEGGLMKIRLASEPIKLYVESCAKDAIAVVVPKFLAQGGRIYSDDVASILPCSSSSCTRPGFISYERYDVSYLESSNIIGHDTGNQLFDVPDYPCNSTDCKFVFDIERPCTYDVSLYCPLPLDPPVFRQRLLSFTEGSYSWEKQLKNKIAYEVNQCINFNASDWYPFEVEEGNVSIEFVFSRDTTNYRVEVPLMLRHPQYEPEIIVHSYDIVMNHRLRSLYDFVKALIYSDSTILNFDIANNFSLLPQFLQGLGVDVVKDASNKDDVVIVSDSVSNFHLNFARENIPPVLDYYDSSPHPVYNIEALIQTYVRVSPIAYDSNEDTVIYTYEGWGQDYKERQRPDGSNERKQISAGERWMDSSLYGQTGREAEIYLNFSDAGTHEFVIRASDGELSDYQIVKIHVTVPGAGSN